MPIINFPFGIPRMSGGSRTFFTVGAFDRTQSSPWRTEKCNSPRCRCECIEELFLGIRAGFLSGSAPLVMVLICAAESSSPLARGLEIDDGRVKGTPRRWRKWILSGETVPAVSFTELASLYGSELYLVVYQIASTDAIFD